MLVQRGLGSVALIVALCMSPPASAQAADAERAPARFELRDESAVLARGEGRVRVAFFLKTQPVLTAARSRKLPALSHGVSAENAKTVLLHFEKKRAARLWTLQRPAAEAEHQQMAFTSAIKRLGGDVVKYDVIANTVTAVVPREAIPSLSLRAYAVTSTPLEREVGLGTSTAAINAPLFWGAGLLGGAGWADRNPVDLAIVSDKIEQDHPAFAGVQFQRPSDSPRNTPCGQNVSGCEHGTEVASMGVSGGAVGCQGCLATDAAERGVAPGLHSVLDADASRPGVDDLAWAVGVGSFGIAPPADAAEVLSLSRGTPSVEDDSSFLQGTDQLIATFGTLIARPSGNEGPARTVNDACTAYDTLCMGAFDHRGTVGPADDVIPDFSSRGPTPGGRKKPDLVAVGVSVFANQHWIRDGNLWEWGEGTSLAAPQGAAAAALIAGSGVTSHLAQKAILIDSARQGRATPSSPMGTQTGWQADWGWGAIDLEAGLRELSNYRLGNVPGGEAQFYRAKTESPGDRATLVWDRRAVGCFRPGCGSTALTLTNLELEQLNPSSGAVEARSASSIDNVEQVRSPATGDVIYKVKAATGVDGLPAEPYALAARRGLTPLAVPRPSVQMTLSAAATRPGDDVRVVAGIANSSPDLSAQNASAQIELPPGAVLAPGSPPARQDLGTLATASPSTTPRTVTWVVRATGDGIRPIRVRSSAARYGEAFGSTDEVTFASDGTPPGVVLSAPAGELTDPRLPVTWTGTDTGVGVADYDIDVSTDGGPFEPWLAATTATSAVYPATAGRTYRFRARARDVLRSASAYVTSDPVRVVAPPIIGPPLLPPVLPPTPAAPVSPRLRVTSVKRRGHHLQLTGRIDSSAARAIAVRGSFKARRGRRELSASARPHGGRFTTRLRIGRPASGTITLRYAGDGALSAQATRVRVRGI